MKSSKLLTVWAVTVVAAFAVPFWNWRSFVGGDWAYFNAQSTFLRSAFFHYGVLPIWDPWMCSGVAYFANPQSRILSPNVIWDLILPPVLANLFSILVFFSAGIWGMFRLCLDFGVSHRTSLLLMILFAFSSWFACHFAEGHIVFASMALLPWVAYALRDLGRPSRYLLLCALLPLMLSDGGVYAFIYSLQLALVGFCFGLFPIRRLIGAVKARPHWYALCSVGSVMWASSRVFPALIEFSGRLPQLDGHSLGLSLVLESFFNPLQTMQTTARALYKFHEASCYVGVATAALCAYGLIRRNLVREHWRLIAVAAIFFWTATGWLTPFNPFTVFERLPLFNHAHVQGRYFIVFFLLLLLWLGKVIDSLSLSHKAFAMVFVILSTQAFVVHQRILLSRSARIGHPSETTKTTISSTNVAETVQYLHKPRDYFEQPNVASKWCYEPALKTLESQVHISKEWPNRPDMVYFNPAIEPADGHSVRLKSYTPKELVLVVKGIRNQVAEVVVNTLLGHGWVSHTSGVRIKENVSPLTLLVAPDVTDVRLAYSPDYVWIALLCWAAGLILLCIAARFS